MKKWGIPKKGFSVGPNWNGLFALENDVKFRLCEPG